MYRLSRHVGVSRATALQLPSTAHAFGEPQDQSAVCRRQQSDGGVVAFPKLYEASFTWDRH